MPFRPIKRLLHSVFTKLLMVILVAGVAITMVVLGGFSVIRFRHITHLDRNLRLYAEYLSRDLGTPPAVDRARQIARRTGMAIRYDHPRHGWQTTGFPTTLSLERARVRRHGAGVQTGHFRGHAFIRLPHAGGNLVFITPRWPEARENAGWILLTMALALAAILAGAYLVIRRVLYPLRPLRRGVEALSVGRLDHRVVPKGHDEFRDLSEAFNMMAARLAELLSNKERLMLDVSHELRSPITRLKVQLELIQDEDIRKSLQADVGEMDAMVTTILEEARLRNTAAGLRRKSTDMVDLIKAVADDFRNVSPGVVCGPLDPITIHADREKMRMVLRNLIDNALKHSDPNGDPVTVSMTGDEKRVSILVADRGTGIAAADLPHLFDPFFRADASRSRKTGGFGLGLSLSKAVVDGHGGSIQIDSIPGEGTRVEVLLPIPAMERRN